MSKLDAVTLILSDAHGQYIPRDFLTDNYNEISVDHCDAWGLNDTNKERWIAAIDPENEWYWEDWEWVLTNAEYIDNAGNKYRLHQDGDLFALCYERMTAEEKSNFGFAD